MIRGTAVNLAPPLLEWMCSYVGVKIYITMPLSGPSWQAEVV